MVTETIITIGETEYKVSGRLYESGVPFPNIHDRDDTLHNHYKVTISKSGSKGKTFDLYDSYAEYMHGKTEMTEVDLKYAFQAILEDAISGSMNFIDFCFEYGYDEDSRRAERIWNACQKTLKSVETLGIYPDDLWNNVNELS